MFRSDQIGGCLIFKNIYVSLLESLQCLKEIWQNLATAGDCLDLYWSVVLAHLSQMLLSESGARDLLNLGKSKRTLKLGKLYLVKIKLNLHYNNFIR